MMNHTGPAVTPFRVPAGRILYLYFRLSCLVFVISGCASLGQQTPCPAGQAGSACIPVDAIEDESVSRSYDSRTWVKPEEMEIDPIRLGMDAEIPVQGAYAKLLGPSQQDGLRSTTFSRQI